MKAPFLVRRFPCAVLVLVAAAMSGVTPAEDALFDDPVYEPVVHSLVPDGEDNVLRGAKIEASAHWEDRVAEFAVDGESARATDHWAAESLPASITLDLGRPRPLNTIRLWTYWGDGRHYRYWIEGSADNENWTVLEDQRENTQPSTAEGRLFRFATHQVRFVRLTFTHCSSGDSAHVVEIAGGAADAKVLREWALWEEMSPELHGALGSVDARYDRASPPETRRSREWEGTAWRGERISLQALLWTAAGAKQVRCTASSLKTGTGETIPAEAVRCRFVRYVIADRPSGSAGTGCGPIDPARRHLVPDILDNAERLDVPPRTTRPVWITIDVPREAAPGSYRGTIAVRAAGQEGPRFTVDLEVLHGVVPAPGDFSFRLDLWQNPWAVARTHHVEPFSDTHLRILEPHLRMLADAGQKFITTYLTHDAWGESIYHNEGTMVEWIREPDGRWRFDYTNFDRYVELALRCGITTAITCYTPVSWKNRYRYLDEATGDYVHATWSPSSQEYESFWLNLLEDLEVHLEQRDWYDRTYLGINENRVADTLATIKVIKKANPSWKITYAGNWHPELNEVLDDYCMIIHHTASAETIRQRRHDGRTSTFYVCCAPGRPNSFTFSPPAESTWMGWHAAASGYDGFLRWAYDSWTADPLHDSRHVLWSAGDCWLVYPGPRSSIRFERLREGIVDHEKLRILRKALVEKKNGVALEKVDDMLGRFTYEAAQDPEHTSRLVDEAKQLLLELTRITFGS